MSSDEVKVVSFKFSPFAVRVQIALKIKGVDYESLEENLSSKSDLLLKSNPVHKKVPVLIHGGRPIAESLVILQYIDEVWPSGPAILPVDPYERATARFWAAFIDDQWSQKLRSMLRPGEDEAGRAATAEQLLHGLSLFEDILAKRSGGDGRFFGGDRIGYIDLVLGTILPWISVVQRMFRADFFDETKTPRLFKWAQDFSEDVHVKDVMPDLDQIFEYVQDLYDRITARTDQKSS